MGVYSMGVRAWAWCLGLRVYWVAVTELWGSPVSYYMGPYVYIYIYVCNQYRNLIKFPNSSPI